MVNRVLLDPRANNDSVAKPTYSSGCWAQKRLYVGSVMAQFAPCAKPHRPGFLTCHWHQDREAAAQALAAKPK